MSFNSQITSTEIERLLNYSEYFQNVESQNNNHNMNEMISEFYNELSNTEFLLVFDWIGWLKENEVFRNLDNDIEEFIKKADLETLRKLMTAYIRGDRFNEGLFLKAVSSGKVGIILRRLKEINE
ncbi:hypothetical protein SAMN05661091_1685 [Paenibacillus uliginis N3/975]|uniref:Uncharacterized protein n=1 Tax=Paenibacillus uliginis N3/975 TaxID=1313296 RepID=A0A1X7H489_9BACL|nr:DUF6508 domain-containing protein [Paenibacillus uliginis]SMF79332.1 hypothetical protein SAMN05661091_1685 [Paenibacillus uliginis N3/975]